MGTPHQVPGERGIRSSGGSIQDGSQPANWRAAYGDGNNYHHPRRETLRSDEQRRGRLFHSRLAGDRRPGAAVDIPGLPLPGDQNELAVTMTASSSWTTSGGWQL